MSSTMPTKSKNVPDIINLTLEAASAKAIKQGFIIRPQIVDGKPKCGSCEFRTDRLNVCVDNGVITGILDIG